jgi:hypothetical protein
MPPLRLRGKSMRRASIYIASTIALAAVLAIIATGITTQWQQEHRTTQLVKIANLPWLFPA